MMPQPFSLFLMQADLKIRQTSANILLNCFITFNINAVLTVNTQKVVTWPTIPLQLRIKDVL